LSVKKKVASLAIFTLLLLGMLSFAFNIKPAKAEWTGTVYIRADGSIDPPDAPILTYDNMTYILMDNITSSGDGVIVQRSNIIVNGTGHRIQGSGALESKGLVLSGVVNVTVSNVKVSGFYFGFWLDSSRNCFICGNIVEGNSFGITIYNSAKNNHICRNRIVGGNGAGVYAVYPWWGTEPRNNKIYENYIADNYMGLLLFSSDNEIYENNITHNGYYAWYGYGISISGSGNKIYHNNFIGNAYQAKSYDGNVWDDGYPSGGNFWSDYTGRDIYRGPFQNQTGSDCIGDTPYVIDENNIDHYPLMNPWPVKGWVGPVYIRADGSINPPDAPMITYDNLTYTLTDNIISYTDGIVVEKDNTIIEGNGYTLYGS
jgi:parallel beta-helix repeat protein